MSMQVAAAPRGGGALGALVTAGIRFSGALRPPSWLAMLHGALAAVALSLLAYTALIAGVLAIARAALGLLVLAALGGAAINLKYGANLLPLPIPLVIGDALMAASGFALLLLSLLNVLLGLPHAGS